MKDNETTYTITRTDFSYLIRDVMQLSYYEGFNDGLHTNQHIENGWDGFFKRHVNKAVEIATQALNRK